MSHAPRRVESHCFSTQGIGPCLPTIAFQRLGGCLAGVKHIETSVYAFTIVTSIGYGNFAPTTGACSIVF